VCEPDALLEGARLDEPGRRLAESLATFDADECPGVPTWVVAGERYWGKDRVDWLVEQVRALLA
jgi:2-hydroxychromene-2-carboxylate isomerase